MEGRILDLMIVGLVWAAVWLVVGKDGPYSVSSAREEAQAGTTGKVERVSFRRIAALPTFWGGVIGMFAIYGMVAVILTWLLPTSSRGWASAGSTRDCSSRCRA